MAGHPHDLADYILVDLRRIESLEESLTKLAEKSELQQMESHLLEQIRAADKEIAKLVDSEIRLASRFSAVERTVSSMHTTVNNSNLGYNARIDRLEAKLEPRMKRLEAMSEALLTHFEIRVPK